MLELLCCNEEFKNALAEIQHETHQNGAGSLWIEMLVQGEVGRNNPARREARASSSAAWSGSSRARLSTSRSGQMRIVICRASKPGICSRRAPDSAAFLAGGLRRHTPRSVGAAKRKWSGPGSKSSSCSGVRTGQK